MKSHLITLLFLCLCLCLCSWGQEISEVEQLFTVKSQELDSLKQHLKAVTIHTDSLTKEVAKLKDIITPYPRRKFGLFGTGGLNLSTFSSWLSKDQPNTVAANIGFTVNGLLEIQQEKYFWNNAFNNNLGWLRFDDKDNPDDESAFQVASDAFNFTSLYGWKINRVLALSVLTEYRTSLLNGTLNNPGYLDLGGAGVTWTPAPNFKAVFHSLNFNWVFSKAGSSYESSLGAKVILDYAQQFNSILAWKSNLSVFTSYEDIQELSNWTWINHFSTAVKGIGVGLDIGLRNNPQEAVARKLKDNPLQFYWVLGVTYGLSKTW